MEKQIIDGHLNAQQREDLKNQIYDNIKDSIEYSGLTITWHEMVSFDVYFDDKDIIELEENVYRITEENMEEIWSAFEDAREEACREYREEHKLNPMTWMAPIIGGMGG